jgi:hypothetical protein
MGNNPENHQFIQQNNRLIRKASRVGLPTPAQNGQRLVGAGF